MPKRFNIFLGYIRHNSPVYLLHIAIVKEFAHTAKPLTCFSKQHCPTYGPIDTMNRLKKNVSWFTITLFYKIANCLYHTSIASFITLHNFATELIYCD